MLSIKNYFILIFVVIILPFNVFAQNGNKQAQTNSRKNSLDCKILVNANKKVSCPVLAVTPREVNMGTIGPGETLSGVFMLKNMGSGILTWNTSCPEGWKVIENEKLTSTVKDDANYLHLEIHVGSVTQNVSKAKLHLYPAELILTAKTGKLICRTELNTGMHREKININSVGGQRTIFITYKVVSIQDLAQINLNPERLDMGSIQQGKTISKKIRLTNKGKEILKWSVAEQKQKNNDVSIVPFKKGKYISFINEEIRGSGEYIPPLHLKESMDVNGKWTENDGYPSSSSVNNSLKFRFRGTGLILYFTSYPNVGNLTVYLDEKLVNDHDWFAEQQEKVEMLVANGLPDTDHFVMLMNKEGHLDVEGVKVLGENVMRGPDGWINIFPYSGSTTLETEYISVNLNTAHLKAGLYGDNIVFNSNGGEGLVEVFVEVVSDKITKAIDIYRYSKGSDFLFTANPQAAIKILSQNGYVKEGIAFRLFVPDVPGTTSFYRWYNPQRKDHFYHYDPKGGGKQLQGYVFEGSLGNIATSRMMNTRELYRWFNSITGHHFYTTDPNGEKAARNGYKFDGIAGYVR